MTRWAWIRFYEILNIHTPEMSFKTSIRLVRTRKEHEQDHIQDFLVKIVSLCRGRGRRWQTAKLESDAGVIVIFPSLCLEAGAQRMYFELEVEK